MARVSWTVLAVALVAGCSGAAPDAPVVEAPEQEAVEPAEPEPVADAEPEPDGPVEREWWRDLGVVIDPEDFGVTERAPGEGFGVNDIKVARRPDGSYVAVVASHVVGGSAQFHLVESTDLRAWTELTRFDMESMLSAGFFIGTLLALPDGTLTMIGVSDASGVVSASSPDGGMSWAADPGPLITADAFEDNLRLVSAAVVERPEGGWRMYVSANDCDAVNLHGEDNCPTDEPLQTWTSGAESVYSATSDDLVTWTAEPGVRFRGSPENGSMNHLDAWVDDAGRYRLTGGLKWNPAWVWPDPAPEPEDGRLLSELPGPGGGLIELVSDDGLDFDLADYRDYRLVLSDVQVVPGPDGAMAMLAGVQGDRPEDQRGQIRLLTLTTISWELDPVVPLPVAYQVPPAERLEDPFISCFRIDVGGEGTLRFDARAAGWPWNPGSAPDDVYEIVNPVVEAPGSVFFKRQDRFDVDDRYWAMNLVAIDEDGVSWMAQPFAFAQYGVPGEVHGHDFDSFPCPA